MTDQKLPPHVEKAIDEAVQKGEDPILAALLAYGSLDDDIELRKKDDDERRSKVRTPGS